MRTGTARRPSSLAPRDVSLLVGVAVACRGVTQNAELGGGNRVSGMMRREPPEGWRAG